MQTDCSSSATTCRQIHAHRESGYTPTNGTVDRMCMSATLLCLIALMLLKQTVLSMPERRQVMRSRQNALRHRQRRLGAQDGPNSGDFIYTKGTKSCERKGATSIAHAVQNEGTVAWVALISPRKVVGRQKADGTCVGLDCDHETGYSFDPQFCQAICRQLL